MTASQDVAARFFHGRCIGLHRRHTAAVEFRY